MVLAELVLVHLELLGVAFHYLHVHGVGVQTHAAQGCVSEDTCRPWLTVSAMQIVVIEGICAEAYLQFEWCFLLDNLLSGYDLQALWTQY